MRLIILSLVSTVALAACSEQTPAPAPAEPVDATPVAEPTTPTPAPRPTPPADQPAAEACGAAERQDWVGKARSGLPTPPAGARVFETGDMLTQDLRADRLNVEIDPATQTVVRVTCG